MKKLILLILLLPFYATAQVNGSIQKTTATDIIRYYHATAGIDTLPPVRLTGIANGMTLIYNSTTKKWHASTASGNFIQNQTGSNLSAQTAKFHITDTIKTNGKIIGASFNDLVLRVNQNTSSFAGLDAGLNNTGSNSSGFGENALKNATGTNISGFGLGAFNASSATGSSGFGWTVGGQSTGQYSVLGGYFTGQRNNGAFGVGLGYYSLEINESPYATGVGSQTLQFGSGLNATGIGNFSLQSSGGDYPVAVGDSTGVYNEGSYNTYLGAKSGQDFLINISNQKTFDATDISGQNITITGHGFTPIGGYVNLKYEVGAGSIAGMTNGLIYSFLIVDANTLQSRCWSSCTPISTATGTGHKLTPQTVYANSTLVGANTYSTASNRVILGDSNVTSVMAGQTGTATVTASSLTTTDGISQLGSSSIVRHIISANNNVGRVLSYRTGNVQRWALRVDGNETGSNVGGDIALRRYSDAGAFIDNAWSVVRSTGVVTFSQPISGSVTGNAATVTTNANLTGDVTSIGNATTYNGIVPITKGGTGSATKNFIDLTNDQSVAGLKTFSSTVGIAGGNALTIESGTTGNSVFLQAPVGMASSKTITLPDYTSTLYGTGTGSITSAQLATSLTDETGTGSAVFSASPTIVTPTILAINQSGSGTLNIGANTSVKATQSIGKTNTTGFGTSDNYLQLGQGENGAGGTRLIGFGYSVTANTNQPAYIGYVETSNSGETNGDLIFGTRSVTTDTAPTTRLTVKASGDVLVASGSTFGIGGVANSVTSGTYTPTLTNISNTASSTTYSLQYMRVGNTVTVSGRLTVQASSASDTEFRITLPVASNFSATTNAGGSGVFQFDGYKPVGIKADITNDEATFFYSASSTATNDLYFSFTYQVL